MTYELKLPKLFYWDHLQRECGDASNIVKETQNHFFVRLTEDTFDDLFGDADYYTECGSEMWEFNRGLVMSARATFKILQKAKAAKQVQS